MKIQENKVAASYLRGKAAMSPGAFGRLPDQLKGLAFTAAGLENPEIIRRVRDLVASRFEGKTWQEARKEIANEIGDVDGAKARAQMILRINGNKARAAARYAAATEVSEAFPFWMYQTMTDGRERAEHQALNGKVLPWDDPFWDTHYPPWDWGCRCIVIKLTPNQAREQGLADAKRLPGPSQNGFSFDPRNLQPDMDAVREGYEASDWTDFCSSMKSQPVAGVPGIEDGFDWIYEGFSNNSRRQMLGHVAETKTEMAVIRSAVDGSIVNEFKGDISSVSVGSAYEDFRKQGLKVIGEHVHTGPSAFPSPSDALMAAQWASAQERVHSRIQRYILKIDKKDIALYHDFEQWKRDLKKGVKSAGQWQEYMLALSNNGKIKMEIEYL